MADEPRPQSTSPPRQWEKLKPAARRMRREPTAAEDALWQRIRNRRIGGAKFRRQHTVEGFIVDFVCIESRLIIEVDGGIHSQTDQQAFDVERQAFLKASGFRVLRFTNAEVLESPETVAQTIAATLESMSSTK
jgi:very-short-patch-repair endonuclease